MTNKEAWTLIAPILSSKMMEGLNRALDEAYVLTFCALNDYEKKQKWISVEERLPEEIGQAVLVVVDGKVEADEWEGNRGERLEEGDGHVWTASGFFVNTVLNVTHWRPFPEPPKEVTK